MSMTSTTGKLHLGQLLHLWNQLHNRNVRHSEDELSRRHSTRPSGLWSLSLLAPRASIAWCRT